FLSQDLDDSNQKAQDIPSSSLGQRSDPDFTILQFLLQRPSGIKHRDHDIMPTFAKSLGKEDQLSLLSTAMERTNKEKDFQSGSLFNLLNHEFGTSRAGA